MKRMMFVFTLSLLSASSFAGSGSDYTKYVCNSYDTETGKITNKSIVLNKAYNAAANPTEGDKVAYEVSLYEGIDFMPEYEAEGTLVVDDVVVTFKSKDKKMMVRIYLDEIEQSYMVKDGKEETYICR